VTPVVLPTLTGTVVRDADGAAIAGAQVRILGRTGASSREPFTGTPAQWLERLSSQADRFRLERTPFAVPEHRRALRRARAYFDTPEAQQVPRKDVQAVFERIERAP